MTGLPGTLTPLTTREVEATCTEDGRRTLSGARTPEHWRRPRSVGWRAGQPGRRADPRCGHGRRGAYSGSRSLWNARKPGVWSGRGWRRRSTFEGLRNAQAPRPRPAVRGVVRGGARHHHRQRGPALDAAGPRFHDRGRAVDPQRLRPGFRGSPAPRRARGRPLRQAPALRGRPRRLRRRLARGRPGLDSLGVGRGARPAGRRGRGARAGLARARDDHVRGSPEKSGARDLQRHGGSGIRLRHGAGRGHHAVPRVAVGDVRERPGGARGALAGPGRDPREPRRARPARTRRAPDGHGNAGDRSPDLRDLRGPEERGPRP
jgi:hypothetical protein